MKNYFLHLIIIVILLVAAVSKLNAQPQMTLTIALQKQVDIMLTGADSTFSDTVIINWGDGQSNSYVLSELGNKSYKHNYNTPADYTITITGTVGFMDCSDIPLRSLDVSKNSFLYRLDCNNNGLTYLDVSKNINLNALDCGNNPLRKLNVSNDTVLFALVCSNAQLTELDVSKNTELMSLFCRDNRLRKLNVANNVDLEQFDCSNNQLKHLDMSKHTLLWRFICHDNKFSATALNKLFRTLNSPLNFKIIAVKTIYITGNPGTNICDTNIATKKGWEVIR